MSYGSGTNVPQSGKQRRTNRFTIQSGDWGQDTYMGDLALLGGISPFIHRVPGVHLQALLVGNEFIRTKAKTSFSHGLNLIIHTAPEGLMPRL